MWGDQEEMEVQYSWGSPPSRQRAELVAANSHRKPNQPPPIHAVHQVCLLPKVPSEEDLGAHSEEHLFLQSVGLVLRGNFGPPAALVPSLNLHNRLPNSFNL